MAVYTAINDSSAYFKVQLWTGNGSTQSITFDDTDTDMSPNLVWIKERTVNNHELYDSVRGVQKRIYPDMGDDEDTNSTGLTAFGADGFTLGGAGGTNNNTDTYVVWCWNESATSGFDIVTYTGTGSARTVSHSLSAVPHFLMVKKRNATGGWSTGHHSLGWTPEVQLQSSDAAGASTPAFNDTDPTSSVFTLGSGANGNSDTNTFVGYVFTGKQGFSKFGSYTGNGRATVPTFIYTRFKSVFVMVKKTNAAHGWKMYDNKRNSYNRETGYLAADVANVEAADGPIGIYSNGFAIYSSDSGWNGSGDSYVYIAFAEAPLVNSNGVPCNAR